MKRLLAVLLAGLVLLAPAVAGAIYSQDSLASGPRIYGTMLSTGGTVADVDAWPQRIAAVTPAEVQAAAEYVWRNDGAVTAMLTPAEGSR